MTQNKTLIGLDIGERRIGVALADTGVRIAVPHDTLEVNGDELKAIAKLYVDQDASVLVLGYPRNQSGEATKQTEYVEVVAEQLRAMELPVEFQDESLTSVLAENQLKSYNQPYTKGDIDKYAAALILQDYLEQRYG